MRHIVKRMVMAGAVFLAAGLWVTGSAAADEVYIPYITSGPSGNGGWTDYLQVNNSGSSSAEFTVTLYSGGTAVYSATEVISGYDHQLINIKEEFAEAETGKITYSSDGLTFRVSYMQETGGVAEFVMPDTLCSTMGLFFSDFSTEVEAKAAAITNMTPSTVNVTLYAVGSGTILDTYVTAIDPYASLAGTHLAWFPSLSFEEVESIVVAATSSCLSGVVLSGNADASFLLYTPGKALSVSGYEVLGLTTYYLDSDGDGYGDPNQTTSDTSPPPGYVSNGDDCDDTDAGIHPGAEEVADGLDNDCDGFIDEGCGT